VSSGENLTLQVSTRLRFSVERQQEMQSVLEALLLRIRSLSQTAQEKTEKDLDIHFVDLSSADRDFAEEYFEEALENLPEFEIGVRMTRPRPRKRARSVSNCTSPADSPSTTARCAAQTWASAVERGRRVASSAPTRPADSADLRLVLSAEIKFGATTKMRRTTGIRRSRMGKRTSLPEC
jgi:hypothetical protein